MNLQISDPVEKVHDVTQGIVSGVNNHCTYCHLDNHDITQTEFQCFPGSPNQVMFRGKVQDRDQATAREVIYYMEQWISSSDAVTMPVHHARLDINSTCVVLIASLDDPECPGYLTAPPVHTVTTSSDMYSTLVTTTTTTTTLTEQNLITGTQLSPFMTNQEQGNTSVIVGGVVAIVFIITTGFVLIFLPYIIVKKRQSKRYVAYGIL